MAGCPAQVCLSVVPHLHSGSNIYLFLLDLRHILYHMGSPWSFPKYVNNAVPGTDSPVVETLCFHCGGEGLIPAWGTKIPHAVQWSKKQVTTTNSAMAKYISFFQFNHSFWGPWAPGTCILLSAEHRWEPCWYLVSVNMSVKENKDSNTEPRRARWQWGISLVYRMLLLKLPLWSVVPGLLLL